MTNDHTHNITGDKTAERRQGFMLRLNDALRPLIDPITIQETAARLLGEELAADRVMYVEIEERNGVYEYVVERNYLRCPDITPVVGRYSAADYTPLLVQESEAGRSIIVENIAAEPRLSPNEQQDFLSMNIRAFIGAPLLKEGRWVASIVVQQLNPRVWTKTEIDFAEELAERTWAAVDRAKTERALRQSEERFRILADTVPQVIWTNNGSGKAVYFNKRWFEYSGLSEEESAGVGWQAIVHPDDAPASKSRWQMALDKGKVFDTEYRLRRADGVYRWHIGRNVPMHDNEGKVIAWFGSATDIEHIKHTEQQLRESHEQLQVTMENAKDYAIVTLDTTGHIRGWSRGAELIFGFTQQEAIGKFTGIFFTPEQNRAGIPELEIATAIKQGVVNDERWHIRKDGSRIFMNGTMRPIYNPSLAGFVKVARDMTEQKLLEQQKEEFIGIASHELKTPVTSISILAELLLETFEQEQNAQAAANMRKLIGQVNRLTNLIKDLLDTTKIVEGKLAMNLEEIEVNTFIEKEIEELRRISPDHHIVYNFQGNVRIMADSERIGQVLINLLSNAFKYSPPRSTITISTELLPEGIKVSIADQGIGIPVEVQSKIFDRFFRVSGEKMQTYPGMGLGLYISAGIIHRHGGSIFVASKEGEGSTFSFILPVKT